MYTPSKETTAGEWKVIGCLFIIAPLLFGGGLLFLGYTGSGDDPGALHTPQNPPQPSAPHVMPSHWGSHRQAPHKLRLESK